jgi:hypothetical protein
LVSVDPFDVLHDFSSVRNGLYHIYHRIME